MPIYEFICKECGKRFEFDRNQVTAYCCEKEIVRVWSPVGLNFKGSGFYKTDYGGKS